MRPSKLECLQQLSEQRTIEELQTAIGQCTCKELRSFVGFMGVPVRSKEYAIYNNKAGYSELLLQILTCKTTHKDILPAKTRKTKNCNLRLANVLFGEILAPTVDAMNADATQTALDSDQISGNSPFWEKVRTAFVGDNVEYAQVVFRENCFMEFELDTPVLHSSEKLWKMWRELCAAYCSAAIKFERSEGPESAFLGFCRNRVDVYYLRFWLNVKPHLLISVNGKFPREGQRNGTTATSASTRIVVEKETFGEENSGKRKSDVMEQVVTVVDSVAGTEVPSRDEERARLMKGMKQACETLKNARELRLGVDVEEVMRGEVERYAQRLKIIQEEELLC